MKIKLYKIIAFLQSFLYTEKCVICKKISDNSICKNCQQCISYNPSEPIRISHKISIFSASKYKDNLRKAILALKFQNKKGIATILGQFLFNYWVTLEISKNNFEVVPLPIHKSKKRTRRYDQTELIAKTFSLLCNYKLNPKLLIRIKKTTPQYKLNRLERQNNLKNAFMVNTKYLPESPILLIDDIYTTGTTINEAIKALQNAGINNIQVLTLSDVDLSYQSINIK